MNTVSQSGWRVTLDFDGAVTPADTVDALHEAFALPASREAAELWRSGSTDFAERLARRVEMLRVAPTDLDAFANQLPVDWGLSGLLRACARAGVPVDVVSEGYDRVVRRVLERMGLERLPIYAHRLEEAQDGRWRLAARRRAESFVERACACVCARAEGAARPLILLIGDERCRRCLIRRANLVFAKSALASWCAAKGVAHVAIRRIDEVTAHIADLDAARALAKASIRSL